jgi:hypothetical protein
MNAFNSYVYLNLVLFLMFRGTLSSKILKFLLSPIRFTKCLGVRVPLRPPRKKSTAQTPPLLAVVGN